MYDSYQKKYYFYLIGEPQFPKLHDFQIVLRGGGVENEMLVIGWIRCLFKEGEFKNIQFLPMYLMKLICSWYSQEEVHWMGGGYKNNEHFVINVRHILNHLL